MDVLKLRKKGMSLRNIAEETGLGLNIVRTIIDRPDWKDRTGRKHLERIRRDMGVEKAWRARKGARDGLPKRIGDLEKAASALRGEAKGIK